MGVQWAPAFLMEPMGNIHCTRLPTVMGQTAPLRSGTRATGWAYTRSRALAALALSFDPHVTPCFLSQNFCEMPALNRVIQ